MSEHPFWFTGNRQPSITEQVTSGGAPVDLTAATVKFKMRPVGSATLKVDQPAAFKDALGNVRYDWAAADVDTAGQYLVWWEVTQGTKTQDMSEALVEFRPHSNTHIYVELERFKSTAELTGTTFADLDIQDALVAASRMVDQRTGRRFWPDTDATQVRYFTAMTDSYVDVGDLLTLTGIAFDWEGDNVYELDWTASPAFWMLEPRNALLDGTPYQAIRTRGGQVLPIADGAIRVTGKFGWNAPPEQVKTATTLIAARLLKRAREAPFGVAGLGADGAAVRVTRLDPDVEALLAPLGRLALVA